MGFWRDKIMDKIEQALGLEGEYREDQSGFAWIANRASRGNGSLKNGEIDPRWYETPPLGEDWRRLYWTLYCLLEKHPELFNELPDFETDGE